MNGNIYVLLSYKKNNVSLSELTNMGEVLSKKLSPYFDTALTVSFKDISEMKRIDVFVMDKPKYLDSDEEIKKQIIYIFSSKISLLDPTILNIKINYTQFNPNFQPNKQENSEEAWSEDIGMINPKSSDYANSLEGLSKDNSNKNNEFDYQKLSLNYHAVEPQYSFNQVILPSKTFEQINLAIGILKVEHKVFDEWGLRAIIPTASSALSFYGPPGTGKSMAAEAIANKLGKKILSATYADIESKFHGEGPKMVKAIFKAAERDNAVLFLDESDSLLSKRLTNVSDGSAQAINSMRSQLMISLEHYRGIVIFATNLVVNYDKAFLSRLINIEFTMPTLQDRIKIWWQHLKTEKIHVPLDSDVDIDYLASKYEFCGREIKNSVKNACIAAALNKQEKVTQKDFIKACEMTKEETLRVISAKDYTAAKQVKEGLIDPIQKKVDVNSKSVSL